MQTLITITYVGGVPDHLLVVQLEDAGIPAQALTLSPEGDLLSVRDATAAEVAAAIDNEAQNQGVTP